MSYATIITKLGKAAISKAIADREQISLTKMGVGQSKDVISDEWETLPEEAQKFSISDIRVKEDDANIVIVQGILEASVGGFVIRQVGIYGADDKLFAVANVPETIKPLLSEGAAKDLTINFYIALSDTAVINLTVEESSKFASRRYVDTKFDTALVETKANELYAPKTHNHDEVYLKIEDFEKYKNQKSAEEGEFLNKFIKDPINEKWTQKMFCQGDITIYPLTTNLICFGNRRMICKKETSDISPNKFVFNNIVPYMSSFVKMPQPPKEDSSTKFSLLYRTKTEAYFKLDTGLYKYDIANNAWQRLRLNFSNPSFDRIRYINPKFPLLRGHVSNFFMAGIDNAGQTNEPGGYQYSVVIEDFVLHFYSDKVKAFKVDSQVNFTPVDISQVPYNEFAFESGSTLAVGSILPGGSYTKGNEHYYFDLESNRLFKNKDQLDIPLIPIADLQEITDIADGTRYLMRKRRDVSKGVYTDLFDMIDGKKPIRLPVYIIYAEESENGLKIDFLSKAEDINNKTFYETTIPYEELKGLK
nr:MAG TPA: tail collar fiber protein [Caudoviricetes sp.]